LQTQRKRLWGSKLLEKEKRERLRVPSFKLNDAVDAMRLVGEVCGNDCESWLLMVLGKLDLGAAFRELSSREIALGPNLVEEVVVAHAMENEFG
jgi:hypothetical protein